MNHELGINILSQPVAPMVLPIYTGAVTTYDKAGLKETVLPVACRYILYRTPTMSTDASLIISRGQKGALVADSNGTLYVSKFPANYIMLNDDGTSILTSTQGSSGGMLTLVFGYA